MTPTFFPELPQSLKFPLLKRNGLPTYLEWVLEASIKIVPPEAEFEIMRLEIERGGEKVILRVHRKKKKTFWGKIDFQCSDSELKNSTIIAVQAIAELFA